MRYAGAIAIIIAASLWGADGVILRPFLYGLDVGIVVFLEHAIAFVLMGYFLYREKKQLENLDMLDWMSFFWIALFGGAIGTMAIVKSLFLMESQLSVVLLLQKLQPLFAIVLAAIILKERPVKWFYPLSAIAIFGSYLLTFGFNKPEFIGNNVFAASMFALLAAFSFGSSTVFGKRVLKRVNYRVSTYVRFGLTSAIMLAVVLFTRSINKFADVSFSQLGVILVIVFTSGAATLFLYYYGLQKVKAQRATIFELAFPVSAVLLDYLINGEILGWVQMFGALLLVSSMTVIVLLRNK